MPGGPTARLPRKRMINFYIVKRKRDTTEMVACVRAAHPMRRSKARSRWWRAGGRGRDAFNTLQPNPTYAYGRVPRTRLCEPGARSRNSSLTLNIRTSFCPWGSKPSLTFLVADHLLFFSVVNHGGGGGMERGAPSIKRASPLSDRPRLWTGMYLH